MNAFNFTYDGISSEDMGVYIVSTHQGLYDEVFLPPRRIIETKIIGGKRFFQRVELEPLSFSFSIFIHDWNDRDNLRQIARWLFKDYYKTLTFDTNPNRIFYAIVEGDTRLIHNGNKQGIIKLNFLCNSPYSYSHPIKYEDVQSPLTIHVDSDVKVKPKLWIKNGTSGSGIVITNKTTNQIMTIDNLLPNEELDIDCEGSSLISSLEESHNIYRYDDHNSVWLELDIGVNELEFIGDFTLDIEFTQVYLAD